jgi:hypothetical protein
MNRFEMGLCPPRERLSCRKIAESLIGKLTGIDMSACREEIKHSQDALLSVLIRRTNHNFGLGRHPLENVPAIIDVQ